jgi:hypothetical protein
MNPEMTQSGSAITEFREFLLAAHKGQTLMLDEVYSEIQEEFPSRCDDSVLCTHESPTRPEWQHQVRQALDYLKNKSKQITSPGPRQYSFPG